MPETGCLIGVDGGGTKTDYVIFDTEGGLLLAHRGGASNHEGLQGGFEEMRQEIIGNITDMLLKCGLKPGDVKAAAFGLAGIDVPSQKEIAEKMISEQGIEHFKVMNDSFLGIKAGSPSGVGVCSINGTGTTAGGIDVYGNWLQIGGTGYFFGDEAGGGHLSGMAIRAVYDAMYRCGPYTSMQEEMLRLFDGSGAMTFTESVYNKYYTDEISAIQILEILFKASMEGDAVASGILDRSGRQMGRSVSGCIRGLAFGDVVDVVIAGSVSLKCPSPVLLNAFKDEIATLSGKQCNYIMLAHPPVAGAIAWAREMSIGRFDKKFFDDAVVQIMSVWGGQKDEQQGA